METHESTPPRLDIETLRQLAPDVLQNDLVGGEACWVTCGVTETITATLFDCPPRGDA